MAYFGDPSALYGASADDEDMQEVYNILAVGLAEAEMAFAEQQGLSDNAPPVASWKPLGDETISITVDRAREKTCEQAQREINFIKERAKSVTDTGQETPTLLDITKYLFGSRSRLYRCFVDEIPAMEGQHKLFLRCMGTFFFCCIFDESLTFMRDEGSKIDTSAFASDAEYSFFWKCIQDADYKTNENNTGHRVKHPFWRKVEIALNIALQELFIAGFTENMQVTIDDDKIHYHMTRMMNDFEPKQVHHVRDNRRGFTVDTAAYTATGCLVRVHCQGKNDSTSTSANTLI